MRALTALLAGEADLAAAWSSLSGDEAAGYSFGSLTSLVAEGGLSMDQIRIVWAGATREVTSCSASPGTHHRA